GYDELVLATGAAPLVPDWARGADGAPLPGTGAVSTLDDGREWLDRIKTDGDVLVAGGGYIGLEMVETALARGHRCTLLTRGRFMHTMDREMAQRIVDAMRNAGVDVREGAEVVGLDVETGRVTAARTADGQHVPGELVVLAMGLSPRTEMVADQLPLGEHRGLLPDARGRVDADRGVWAAGDCCEVHHRLLDAPRFLPLGTHANKLGRALGDNLGDPASSLTFDGALGTALTRFVGGEEYLEIAMT